MLTQNEADRLIALPKLLADKSTLQFPRAGDALQLDAKSEDGREAFLIDANRKGRIRLKKCTYQERYAVIEILLRLDIGGPPHENPDGTIVACPHLHTYREGYGDKWADPTNPGLVSNPTDLALVLHDFLSKLCNVRNVPQIQRSTL